MLALNSCQDSAEDLYMRHIQLSAETNDILRDTIDENITLEEALAEIIIIKNKQKEIDKKSAKLRKGKSVEEQVEMYSFQEDGCEELRAVIWERSSLLQEIEKSMPLSKKEVLLEALR